MGALAGVCRAEGATLAFEFMGFAWSAVRTLRSAIGVADATGGLPLVLDTFHWALGGSRLLELDELAPERIAVVHVNDVPTRDVAGLQDRDRVLPGNGVLDLATFYRKLADIGYDGVFSVELFNPALWARGAAAAARQAYSVMGALALS